jgi:hypothetical protein
MSLTPGQWLRLLDGQDQILGQVIVDRLEDDLVFGRFVPAADYARVQPLFDRYVMAANDQALGVVGELAEAISALGLDLVSSDGGDLPAIHDVQIGEGSINFRVQPPVSESPSATRAPAPPFTTIPGPFRIGTLGRRRPAAW